MFGMLGFVGSLLTYLLATNIPDIARLMPNSDFPDSYVGARKGPYLRAGFDSRDAR